MSIAERIADLKRVCGVTDRRPRLLPTDAYVIARPADGSEPLRLHALRSDDGHFLTMGVPRSGRYEFWLVRGEDVRFVMTATVAQGDAIRFRVVGARQ